MLFCVSSALEPEGGWSYRIDDQPGQDEPALAAEPPPMPNPQFDSRSRQGLSRMTALLGEAMQEFLLCHAVGTLPAPSGEHSLVVKGASCCNDTQGKMQL
jgi:hypothetical protein